VRKRRKVGRKKLRKEINKGGKNEKK